MSTKDIVQTTASLTSFLLPFGGIGLLLAVAYIVSRTASAHVVRSRLWRLVNGASEVADAVVNKFLKERNDVMAFRNDTGIKVRSIASARRVVEWLELHNEDVSSVSRAGRYFDCERLQVVEHRPGVKTMAGGIVLVAVLTLLTMPTVALSLSNRAYYTFTDSGTWFSATAHDVASVRWKPETAKRTTLTRDDCATAPAPSRHFTMEEVQLLCGFLKHPDLPQHLSKALRQQVAGMGVLAFSFALVIASVLRMLRQVDAANALQRRLQEAAAAGRP